jgi:hypothetical protein
MGNNQVESNRNRNKINSIKPLDNNNHNNNNQNKDNSHGSFVHAGPITDLYESHDLVDKVARSAITELKIKQYQENNKEAQKIINRVNQQPKTVYNYRQELKESYNGEDDKKRRKSPYVEKAFAASQFAYPIMKNNPVSNSLKDRLGNKFGGTGSSGLTGSATDEDESYLKYIHIFDPKNITIELINKIKKKSVIPPYSETTLDRMEEAARTDGLLKRGIFKKWDFIQGADMKIILQLTNEYDTRDEKRKMLKVITKFQPYRTALNEARFLLEQIDFKPNLHDAGVQSSFYGRGALEKIRALDNTIIGLNVLETRFMGNPIFLPVNSITKLPKDAEKQDENIVENTIDYSNENRTVSSRHIFWKMFGIEYNDPESIINSGYADNMEIIQMKDMIYITRDDVSISPGTKGFGLSEIEPSLDGSETKRIMKTYDFKEISRSSYSSFGVIKALNSNITKAELQYLVDSMEVNGWCATAHQIEVDTFSLTSDSRIMIEILDAMNRESGRDIDIPSPLLGYEHVQNYASLQQTLQSWKESVLDADRRRIAHIIEKQLLEEILDTSLKRQNYCVKLNENFELQLYELDPLTKKPKKQLVPDPSTMMQDPLGTGLDTEDPEENKAKDKPTTPNNMNPNNYALKDELDPSNKDKPENAKQKPDNPPDNNPNSPIKDPINNLDSQLPLVKEEFVKPTVIYKDEVTGTIEAVVVPPIKLSFEITDPNFSIFKDKGEIGIQLKGINAIGIERLLELVDMPDEIDDAVKREAEQKEMERKNAEMGWLQMQGDMANSNRKTDAEVMKMRAETQSYGLMDKFMGDDEEAQALKRGEKDVSKEEEEEKKGTNSMNKNKNKRFQR